MQSNAIALELLYKDPLDLLKNVYYYFGCQPKLAVISTAKSQCTVSDCSSYGRECILRISSIMGSECELIDLQVVMQKRVNSRHCFGCHRRYCCGCLLPLHSLLSTSIICTTMRFDNQALKKLNWRRQFHVVVWFCLDVMDIIILNEFHWRLKIFSFCMVSVLFYCLFSLKLMVWFIQRASP